MSKHGEGMAFLRDAINRDTDECILWPFGKYRHNGYGAIYYEKRNRCVHRVALIITTGEDPAGMDAAHSCNVRACVNVRHLSWKTRLANTHDKFAHGTMTRGRACWKNVFSEEQVLEIVSLLGVVSQRKIAERYGVTQQGISDIATGRNWSWLTGRTRGGDQNRAA
jgi:hypothetical protein